VSEVELCSTSLATGWLIYYH